jgi:glutamine synthetase
LLTLEELEQEIGEGTIDTVVAWLHTTCRAGQMGKRIQGEFFLEEVAEHGVEGCRTTCSR